MLHQLHHVVVDDRHLDAEDHHLVHQLLVYLICMAMRIVVQMNHLDVE
jgi:hypothetical protein